MKKNRITDAERVSSSTAYAKLLVISRFFRWFRISCPKCKVGKLNQDDIHHCWGGGELNVYTCDKCKSQFI